MILAPNYPRTSSVTQAVCDQQGAKVYDAFHDANARWEYDGRCARKVKRENRRKLVKAILDGI